ncbi:MAG: hypothetical protein E5299_01449 [Burkholderia gladioli]|nr:MAG: hypothetical protein E5299_01449 [Burkholderia gladioli]
MSSAVTAPTTPSYAMRPLLHAVLFLGFRHARVPLIGQRISPLRGGVAAALDAIARHGRRAWKKDSGYHRRSLAENAMYRFKTLTGKCLRSRVTSSDRGRPSRRRRISFVCNPFVSLEIMPFDAIVSSRSIYATTPHTWEFSRSARRKMVMRRPDIDRNPAPGAYTGSESSGAPRAAPSSPRTR